MLTSGPLTTIHCPTGSFQLGAAIILLYSPTVKAREPSVCRALATCTRSRPNDVVRPTIKRCHEHMCFNFGMRTRSSLLGHVQFDLYYTEHQQDFFSRLHYFMHHQLSLPPHELEELAAPQLLGVVLNWCLYGALVVQFYVYSYNFPRDTRFIRLLVYIVLFLETVQTVLSGADLYYWFAAGFGNVERLTTPYASPFDVPIMGSLVSLSVQFFFVFRIWILSEQRSWWLCVIICLLSVVGTFGAFAAGILSHRMEKFISGVTLKAVEVTWIIANTLSDLLIASAMFCHLRRIWARDGNLSSHALVSIVRLIVETNLATTTVSIASFLMVVVYPDKNWYLCPTYVLGKLYSNTLLVSLNNRISIRDTYGARGGAVDCEDVAGPAPSISNNSRPESTTETMITETEKPQEDIMRQLEPVPEAAIEEWVIASRPASADIARC